MADRRENQVEKNLRRGREMSVRQASGSAPLTREEEIEILRRGGYAVRRREHNREVRIQRSIQERQNAARHFTLTQTIVILVSVAIVFVSGCAYLYSRSSLRQSMKTVESMQEELEQQVSDNNAKEAEINSSIDVDEIYRKALEMGMTVPSKSQVITYSASDSGLVSQRETVPEQ